MLMTRSTVKVSFVGRMDVATLVSGTMLSSMALVRTQRFVVKVAKARGLTGAGKSGITKFAARGHTTTKLEES